MLVILPFEERFYQEHAVQAVYVGNPLGDALRGGASPPARAPAGVLALLPDPASRRSAASGLRCWRRRGC